MVSYFISIPSLSKFRGFSCTTNVLFLPHNTSWPLANIIPLMRSSILMYIYNWISSSYWIKWSSINPILLYFSWIQRPFFRDIMGNEGWCYGFLDSWPHYLRSIISHKSNKTIYFVQQSAKRSITSLVVLSTTSTSIIYWH